jgi:hypothetical protein
MVQLSVVYLVFVPAGTGSEFAIMAEAQAAGKENLGKHHFHSWWTSRAISIVGKCKSTLSPSRRNPPYLFIATFSSSAGTSFLPVRRQSFAQSPMQM